MEPNGIGVEFRTPILSKMRTPSVISRINVVAATIPLYNTGAGQKESVFQTPPVCGQFLQGLVGI